MRVTVLLALGALLSATAPASAEDAGEARARERCGTPVCHNSVRPWRGTGMRLDEVRVWRERDAHRRSYAVLLDQRSRRIARRLGSEPAERRADCLACHASGTPAGSVACEACHGDGAWVETHSRPGASHADSVARGLRPLGEPRQRADLCVSCHLGGAPPEVVDHRLLAAGHPRLGFELDSLTALEPPHWRTSAPAVVVWAVGQGLAAARLLDAVAGESPDAPWPALELFDCQSCHHEVGTHRAAGGSGRPGVPRRAVGALVAYAAVLRATDADEGAALAADAAALATASRADARGAGERVRHGLDRLARWTPEAASLVRILDALASAGGDGAPLPYTTAEQVFYGLQSTLVTVKRTNALSDRRRRAIHRQVLRLADVVQAHERYDAWACAAVLRDLRATLRTPIGP
jgi:hypothetical protein